MGLSMVYIWFDLKSMESVGHLTIILHGTDVDFHFEDKTGLILCNKYMQLV